MTVRILIGDVRDWLIRLPSDSFDCVVTSPPYWGLRDYGTATWVGGDDGCDHRMKLGDNGPASAKQTTSHGTQGYQFRDVCGKCGARRIDNQIGLERTLGEHLDVMVAVFANVRRVLKPTGTLWLNYGDCYANSTQTGGNNGINASGGPDGFKQARQFRTPKRDYASLKPKDLCMIPNRLAIALQDDGWWVRSEIIWAKPNPMPESIKDRPTSSHEKIWLLSKAERYFYDADAVAEPANNGARLFNGGHDVGKDRQDNLRNDPTPITERNLRNVWRIGTSPFPEAHFATFPPELAERCIKAGCPPSGLVLDPFGGAGTTGLVADRLGRSAVLIELNPEYAELARSRIHGDAPLFNSVEAVA